LVVDLNQREPGRRVGDEVYISERVEEANDKRKEHDGIADCGYHDALWDPGLDLDYFVTYEWSALDPLVYWNREVAHTHVENSIKPYNCQYLPDPLKFADKFLPLTEKVMVSSPNPQDTPILSHPLCPCVNV
jgi:hypothetical protein